MTERLSNHGNAVAAFLDAVDQVLNSNTFLVFVPDLDDSEPKQRVRRVIGSEALRSALLRADLERDWELFHTWESDPLCRVARTEPMFRAVEPALGALTPEATRQRLLAMVTAGRAPAPERPAGWVKLWSPHRRQRSEAEAAILVDAMWPDFVGSGPTALFGVATDFLYPHGEGVTGYLDGLGSDTVTAAVRPDGVALLFTNGMP